MILGDAIWDVMRVGEEAVVGNLGVVTGQEALDKVDCFGVEAKAGKCWESMSWLTKLKKLEMLNMRAVDFRPLYQVWWMS